MESSFTNFAQGNDPNYLKYLIQSLSVFVSMIHFMQTFFKQNTEILLERHCEYTKNVILLKQNT